MDGMTQQTAPVSATEPEVLGYWRDDACKRADLDADDVVSDISVSVANEILAHIDTLTARVAELERVTEAFTDEQIDAGIRAVEALRIMRKVWEPDEKRDAFLTAARGGG